MRLLQSLRVRLLLLVLLGVLPALGLIFATAREEQGLARQRAQQEARAVTDAAAFEQRQLVAGTRQLLIALAQVPEIRGEDAGACRALLAELQPKFPFYTGLSVARPDGRIECVEPYQPVYVGDRDYFLEVMRTRDFASSGYLVGRVTGKAVRIFAYPAISETGEVHAVVIAGLDLAWVNQLAKGAVLPPGAVVAMMDESGTFLARHPDPDLWVGKDVADSAATGEIVKARSNGLTAGSFEATGVDGIRRLWVFASLGGENDYGAYTMVGLPSSLVFADANRLLARNLAALGVTTALAMAAAWFVGDLLVVRRTRSLVRATRRLAAGDLGARSARPYGTGEIGELACAFNEMAEALELRHNEVLQAQEKATGLYQEAEGARKALAASVKDLEEAQKRLQAALEGKEALLREVHHRIKNNLAVVSGLLSLQSTGMKDAGAQSAFQESGSRVRAIALVHEKLYRSDTFSKIDFAHYAQDLVADMRSLYGTGGNVQILCAADTVFLESDKAVPCGLILHELTTNALKHAFPANRPGVVRVEVREEHGRVRMTVSDDGVGLPHDLPPNSPGLGLRLVDSLASQIGGTVKMDKSQGASFTIEFPAAGSAQ